METSQQKLYLGLDFGTQSGKLVVVTENLDLVQEISINFDKELPEFGTSGGVNKDATNPKVVTAQPIMWIKALDILMEKLRLAGVDIENIIGISGSAQQHGSVYWKRGSRELLNSLDPSKFLHDQLALAFSVQYSPIWMDASTTEYCKILENHVGGPEKLAFITGSRAFERFTGPQISKIYRSKREAFNATERISLISSFLASIFLGDYANIDFSDGSGMNLLDIRKKCWSPVCLDAATEEGVGNDLMEKLGEPIPTETILGNISGYFQERYGFNPECKIVAFTGDNPSSFAGLAMGSNDIAVSLGTSDTVFVALEELPSRPNIEGHILINPVSSKDHYMALLCFRNGSLTRERIKKSCADNSWKIFNELLSMTPRGNYGNLGLYFDLWEILPKIKNGDHRFNKQGAKLNRFTSHEIEVRALIEGQFISRRIHAEKVGMKITENTRILATGDASSNLTILQVLSDVFNAPVCIQESSNSADFGACYRVKHSLSSLSFKDVVGEKHGFRKACIPFEDVEEVYNPLAERYSKIEQQIIIQ